MECHGGSLPYLTMFWLESFRLEYAKSINRSRVIRFLVTKGVNWEGDQDEIDFVDGYLRGVKEGRMYLRTEPLLSLTPFGWGAPLLKPKKSTS